MCSPKASFPWFTSTPVASQDIQGVSILFMALTIYIFPIYCVQETNPAELLRLYLSFDLLEEAAHLALDYIDAVLGPQKEEFALQVFHGICSYYTCVSLYSSPCSLTNLLSSLVPQTTLHASAPSVWLPYSALDHLQAALQRAQQDTPLEEVCTQY